MLKWIIGSLWLLSSSAFSAELAPLSSIELYESCVTLSKSRDAERVDPCSTYLRAFIEGSTLVELQPVSTEPHGESFTQRALRTRIGQLRATAPRYCVNGSVTLDDFILQMLVQAEDRPPRAHESASVLIYGTLARYHPCNRRISNEN